MRKTVAVEWMTDGWFGVRLEYDAALVSALKEKVPAAQRRWSVPAQRWEFDPLAYDLVDAVLWAVWDEQLPEKPAMARVGQLPVWPSVLCAVCGSAMSSARVRDTCGGLRPCPVPVVLEF